MVEKDGIISAADKEAIALLKDFLPKKIFDMHFHPGKASFNPTVYKPGTCFSAIGTEITWTEYLRDQARFYPEGFELRTNMIMNPDPAMFDGTGDMRRASVEFLVEELEKHPGSVAEVAVLAGDTREDIEKMLVHPRIRGFKCYHWTVDKPKTWDCTIGEYLTEAVWEIANERNMCITLHMVRDYALSDEENLRYICEHAEKYPNARLILAHAARGFAAWTVVESVEKVAKYPNVYFDFSAVCEPTAFMAIIKACGHKRVFWGSDYPVTMLRGTCASVGNSFLWLYKEQLDACSSNTEFNAYLIGVQNLMAVRTACKLLDLTKEQIEDIFYNNAMEFFGLEA